MATHPASYSTSPPRCVIGIQNEKWPKPNFIFSPPTLPNPFTLNRNQTQLQLNQWWCHLYQCDRTLGVILDVSLSQIPNHSHQHILLTLKMYPESTHLLTPWLYTMVQATLTSSQDYYDSCHSGLLLPAFAHLTPSSTQQQSEPFIMRIRSVPALLSILQWLLKPPVICSSAAFLIWPPDVTPRV